MKKLIKQYPGTKYAALAAFDLLDNKLCGDWQGLPKCPEMEAAMYEKYAKQFPDGPKSAEALYDAAYRQGVLVSMYIVDDQKNAPMPPSNARNRSRTSCAPPTRSPTSPPAPPASPFASSRES